VLKACPVLAFTPDVESALRWFQWTYALTVVPMGVARYERVAWPRPGGAGRQDAWLTAALDYLRLVYNAMVREDVTRHQKAAPAPPKRSGRGR
jgi:hypothetical protein